MYEDLPADIAGMCADRMRMIEALICGRVLRRLGRLRVQPYRKASARGRKRAVTLLGKRYITVYGRPTIYGSEGDAYEGIVGRRSVVLE